MEQKMFQLKTILSYYLNQRDQTVKIGNLTVKGRKHIKMILVLLDIIINNLQKNQTTKVRSIYYQYKDLFQTQLAVTNNIRRITTYLNCKQHDLLIENTSKGLLYVKGTLKIDFKNQEDQSIIENQQISITEDVYDMTKFETNCKFILVLEKDTIFSYLTQFNLFQVTGKGQPDTYTKQLMANFSRKTKIPIFGLADCNYYGMTILYTYKYNNMFPCERLIPIGMFEPYYIKQADNKELRSSIANLAKRLINRNEFQWAEYVNKMKSLEGDEIDSLIREGILIRFLEDQINKWMYGK